MAGSTTNYGLTKPAVGEAYDVDVFNGNSDIIDTEIKKINTAPTVRAATLSGGYAARGSGFASPGFYKIGNQIHGVGSITNSVDSSPAAATLYKLATIPSGHGLEIPSGKVVEFPLNYRNTSYGIYHGIIQVLDDPDAPGTTIVRFALASTPATIAANAAVISLNILKWLNV